MAGSPDERTRGHLIRRNTAVFVALSDLISVMVAGTILLTNFTTTNVRQFPGVWILVALVVIALRGLLLALFTESWKAVIRGVIGAFYIFIDAISIVVAAFARLFPFDDQSKEEAEELDSSVPREKKERQIAWPTVEIGIKAYLIYRTGLYFSLLGVGICAQVVMVAASGGMVDSPFVELLVATFILGQFRSPTEKSATALFLLGVLAAVVTQELHSLLREYDLKRYEGVVYGTMAHLAPLAVIGLMSTIVSVFQIYTRRKTTRNDLTQ